MIGSLFAGISGLNANAMAMTVIGDNIANVNTTAFKTNRSSFANMLSQSLTGAGNGDIGRGLSFGAPAPAGARVMSRIPPAQPIWPLTAKVFSSCKMIQA